MRVAFVSTHGAVRGIMAESIARKMFREAGLKAEIFSAGVDPAERVGENVLKVLEEKGFPTKGLKPRPLSKIPYRKIDILVILSEEAKERCEFLPNHKRRENWILDPPQNSLESLRRLRDQIEDLIRDLLKL
ncbi:MAG: low molecular weight phosphatase family protein [Aquificota bacterium]|nr:low molecular weight phosphatase family protein [Aquificota bacterium]